MTEEAAPLPQQKAITAELFSRTTPYDHTKLGTTTIASSPLLYKGWGKRLTGIDKDPIHPFLYNILSIGTPYKHEMELFPIMKRFISHKLHVDSAGNVFFIVGDPKPTTMFSCHMDTVHAKLTPVHIYATTGPTEQSNDFIFGARDSGRSTNGVPCNVGADDRVGMYIMMRLANAKVPGLYMFHVGEERGGIGSSAIIRTAPEKFKDIKRCIAFDRKGYNEVITHQGGKECASDEFGRGLAEAINAGLSDYARQSDEYKYVTSRNGMFTDSKNYAPIVAECVNLSVGYFDHHAVTEHLMLCG